MNYIQKFKQDYRHIICAVITCISLGLGVLFPNSLPRIAEALRDLLLSILYYLADIVVRGDNPVRVSVTKFQSWKLFDSVWVPVRILPETWEEFTTLWNNYWGLFFSGDNFIAYLGAIGNLFAFLSNFFLALLPVLAVVITRINAYKNKHCTVRNLESSQLRSFKSFLFKRIYPIIAWCKDFVAFLKENSEWYKMWLVIWCLHFNVFALVIAFFAYYLYFVASSDLLSLYGQVLKFLNDLTPIIRFIPGIIWFCAGAWLYNHICRSMAFARLYYYEQCNRAVLRERGVLSVVWGKPRVGKTQLITSMAVSAEIEQFDMAFEIMLEMAIKFPNFLWQRFRDQIKKRIEDHTVVDSRSCREWIRSYRPFFDRITALNYTAEEYRALRKKHDLFENDYTFGYDYTHYRTTYNDNLKITHLFEALEDYACAYVKFTVKTTLLFANYSIRTDSILHDLGNMPFRDNDFLNRDPRYQEAYSHHAHIADYDIVRLGKLIIENNPNARMAPSGVWVVSEIDKERKNMLQLKDVKSSSKETNQLNDLFDACVMMIGHADVIANRHFIRIICDLQRPEAWGAGGRENGEVIYIADKSELAPALPFLSPYWLFQGLFSLIKNKWDKFEEKVNINRSDNTLFMYVMKNIIAKIDNHYKKVEGLFGAQTLKLEIQSGKLEGEVKKEKWRIITKKDRSRRYRTDCLSSVFDSYEPNTMHVDDFIMYAGEVGTQEENALQNSYFQNDIRKMKGMN